MLVDHISVDVLGDLFWLEHGDEAASKGAYGAPRDYSWQQILVCQNLYYSEVVLSERPAT